MLYGLKISITQLFGRCEPSCVAVEIREWWSLPRLDEWISCHMSYATLSKSNKDYWIESNWMSEYAGSNPAEADCSKMFFFSEIDHKNITWKHYYNIHNMLCKHVQWYRKNKIEPLRDVIDIH